MRVFGDGKKNTGEISGALGAQTRFPVFLFQPLVVWHPIHPAAGSVISKMDGLLSPIEPFDCVVQSLLWLDAISQGQWIKNSIRPFESCKSSENGEFVRR